MTRSLRRAGVMFATNLVGLSVASSLFGRTSFPPAGLLGLPAIVAVATWARGREVEGPTLTGRDRVRAGIIACAVTLCLSMLTSLAGLRTVDWLDVGIAVGTCALFSWRGLVRRLPTAETAV